MECSSVDSGPFTRYDCLYTIRLSSWCIRFNHESTKDVLQHLPYSTSESWTRIVPHINNYIRHNDNRTTVCTVNWPLYIKREWVVSKYLSLLNLLKVILTMAGLLSKTPLPVMDLLTCYYSLQTQGYKTFLGILR